MSFANSQTLRAGTSCKMMGKPVEPAMARKCAYIPIYMGLL